MIHDRLGPNPGSRCIVVGGCGGIGRSYVDGLLAADCRVAVLDLARSIAVASPPKSVLAIPADATDEAQMKAGFDAVVDAWGGLDVMAHVAGINPKQARVEEIDFADYERIMQVNLRSAVLAAQLGLAAMKASGGGAMVFVSSGLAVNPEPSFGSYSISKAGLIALTKTIAKEHAPSIRANVVAPGVVDTAFLSGGTGSGGEKGKGGGYFDSLGDLKARILASIPMGRMAVAEDVAGPMLFLTGGASAYMTGQVLYINGGRLMP